MKIARDHPNNHSNMEIIMKKQYCGLFLSICCSLIAEMFSCSLITLLLRYTGGSLPFYSLLLCEHPSRSLSRGQHPQRNTAQSPDRFIWQQMDHNKHDHQDPVLI